MSLSCIEKWSFSALLYLLFYLFFLFPISTLYTHKEQEVSFSLPINLLIGIFVSFSKLIFLTMNPLSSRHFLHSICEASWMWFVWVLFPVSSLSHRESHVQRPSLLIQLLLHYRLSLIVFWSLGFFFFF